MVFNGKRIYLLLANDNYSSMLCFNMFSAIFDLNYWVDLQELPEHVLSLVCNPLDRPDILSGGEGVELLDLGLVECVHQRLLHPVDLVKVGHMWFSAQHSASSDRVPSPVGKKAPDARFVMKPFSLRCA